MLFLLCFTRKFLRQTAKLGISIEPSTELRRTRDVSSYLGIATRYGPMARLHGISGREIGPSREWSSNRNIYCIILANYCTRTTVEKDRVGREHMRMNFNVGIVLLFHFAKYTN